MSDYVRTMATAIIGAAHMGTPDGWQSAVEVVIAEVIERCAQEAAGPEVANSNLPGIAAWVRADAAARIRVLATPEAGR